MILRIQALSTDLANQIAAGEVIERPASVVKELLENARDAGATHIHIQLEYAGLNAISISDNGQGIHHEDLPLAIAAHATSKIRTLNDLYAIDTMGFRGEALASIASIAKLRILSKTKDAQQASQLACVDKQWQVTPCARQQGTTVEVRDLFYNAPVRKRFLKSEKTEFQAIEGVVRRFALSTPEAAIVMSHNGKVALDLPAALDQKRLLMRLEKLFGRPFMQAANYIDTQRAGMRLRGWVSDASYQRSQSDKQWIYVNQRMVKDKLLNHALKQAYESIIYPGRHPACLLYLSIDPAEVDVNVHPTKHELRFQQPRLVHDFIYTQIMQQLGGESTEQPQQIKQSTYVYQPASVSRWQDSHGALAEPVMPSQANIAPKSCHMQSLSPDYGILHWRDRWFMWHKKALIEHALYWHCQKQPRPLPSRPLLVPIQQMLSPEIRDEINEYMPLLNDMGIDARFVGEKLQWKSTPMALPQLPLEQLVELVLQTQPKNDVEMIKLLANAHLSNVTSIDEVSEALIVAFCDAHQKAIDDNQIAGLAKLSDDHLQSIVYG